MGDLSISDRELFLSSLVIQLLKAKQNVETPAQYSDVYYSQKPATARTTSYDLTLPVPSRPFNLPPGLAQPAAPSSTYGSDSSSGSSSPPPAVYHRLPLDRLCSVDAENTSVFSDSRRSSVSHASVSRQLSTADDGRCSTAETGGIAAAGRYKTELCRPFEENGSCRYGDKCQFAHGRAELRNVQRHPKYKTDLCKTFHTTGLCPYGPRCHFIHNDEERRDSCPSTTGSVVGSDYWDAADAVESSPMKSGRGGRLLQRMTSVPHHCGVNRYDAAVHPTSSMSFDRQMSFEPRCQSLPESASQLLSMSYGGFCGGNSSAAARRYLPAASGIAATAASRSRYSLGSQAESPSPSSSFSDSPPPLSPIADDVILTSRPTAAAADDNQQLAALLILWSKLRTNAV